MPSKKGFLSGPKASSQVSMKKGSVPRTQPANMGGGKVPRTETHGKGGGVTDKGIGTEGNLSGSGTASEGGQMGFMPSAGSFSGKVKTSPRSSGASGTSDQGGQIPFMPSKATGTRGKI